MVRKLEQGMRCHLKPTNKSWRCDESYKVKGRWCAYIGAIDSAGATIDFLLSAKRMRTRLNGCFAKL